MSGISNILNTGLSGLLGSQAGIEVTSTNISNVNTDGYSRQRVDYEESLYVNGSGVSQLGTGVTVAQITRLFDDFIEAQYNDKASQRDMYNQIKTALASVESIFNESSADGISAALDDFFNSWESLSADPSDVSLRQTVVDKASTLVGLITQASLSLDDLQSQMNSYIESYVGQVNDLTKQIADINMQIAQYSGNTSVASNGLLDQRATLIRELASIVDINYVDNGNGNLTINLDSGQTLVDGFSTFEIKYEGPSSTTALSAKSNFDGECYFSGSDSYEYTIKVVQGGVVSNASTSGVAQFQVSLDGGKTWLTNDDGTVKTFYARPNGTKVDVGNLEIWFGSSSDPGSAPTTSLSEGDTFTIVPKSGVYWYNPAATDRENITPQSYSDGDLNSRRLTGGALAGAFVARDSYIGVYQEQLDSFSSALVWSVNRIYSQGAATTNYTTVTGSYTTSLDNTALASNSTGLAYGASLSSGASMMFFFNSTTGALASSASMGPLDFDPTTSGIQYFDPNVNSLNDVADAINNTWGTFVTAQIVDHKITITANSGYSFAFGSDATGLYAALGLNTFFTGSNSTDINVNTRVANDTDYLCAGHMDGSGSVASGDNQTALGIIELKTDKITVKSQFYGSTSVTLSDYYASLVARVGSDSSVAQTNYTYQNSLADDLNTRQQEVSGVNLDEEMSNLIKYQHSYQAAAKVISAADQMMQTLLGLKS